jgi:DNA-binding MarR family transcriptional regulator
MATRTLSPAQGRAWASYQRMRTRLAGQISRDLAHATGLSAADFEILAALIGSPEEPVRALALRCGLEWEKSRLSHQLRRMEQRGLVVRESCAEDNRGAVIRVTAAGRALAERATLRYEEAVRRYVVDALTADELATLGRLADRVLANLEEPRHAGAARR